MAKSTTEVKQDSVPSATLLRRYGESKEYRKKYDSKWDENTKYYKGQTSGLDSVASYQSDPRYNKVFEFVEAMRGYSSDNKWGIDVIPASLPKEIKDALESGDPMKVKQAIKDTSPDTHPTQVQNALQKTLLDKTVSINKLLDFLWMDSRMQSKLAQVLLHVFLKGTGFLKCTFDPDNITDAGVGQIETSVVDPFYIYPDPDATCVQDCDFIIEAHPVSVRWVIDRYPDKAAAFLEAMGGTSLNKAPYGSQPLGPANESEGKRVDILECWYNDSTIIEDALDENGNPVAKYPNGRYTLMSAQGFVLEDKPCLYSTWPYVRIVEIPQPGEFFGGCTIERAIGIQKLINQTLRTIIDNGFWLVHGIWVTDTTSGVGPEDLADYGPRDVIAVNPGSRLDRETGPPLPPSIFQMLDQLVEAFDRIVGLPDVLRGIVPSRQPVQTTMMQQESGEVRTRERCRRIEEGLEDLGNLWLDIVGNHWTDRRIIRAKNPVAGFDMFAMSKADLEGWQFDLHVRPGSTTPLDVTSSIQRARELKEMGIQIPDEYFIKLSGLPGLESSINEFESATAAETEALDSQAEPVTPDEFAGMEDPDPTEGIQQAPPEVAAQMSPEEMAQFP